MPGGGPALLFETAGRVQHAGCQQRVRVARSHVPGAWRQDARRPRSGNQSAHDAADARRHHGRAEDAADGGPSSRSDAEDGQGCAVSGNRPARRNAGRPADSQVLARGRRTIHHVAARVHERSRNGHAKYRHVSHAGIRRPHNRHALAAAQRRRAALPGRRAAGPSS